MTLAKAHSLEYLISLSRIDLPFTAQLHHQSCNLDFAKSLF